MSDLKDIFTEIHETLIAEYQKVHPEASYEEASSATSEAALARASEELTIRADDHNDDWDLDPLEGD